MEERRRQSPVHIDPKRVVLAKFTDLTWSEEYSKLPEEITLTNEERWIKISVTYQNGATPLLSGGPLLHSYRLDHVHFHWGMDNSQGSDHTFPGKFFPMEMHCVHIRKNLTREEALELYDGTAVVSYLAELGEDNPILEKIAKGFPFIKKPSSVVLDDLFCISELIPSMKTHYYFYSGSLTTTPFKEAVMWFIAKKPVTVSQKQLEQFRTVALDNELMQNNLRATQPLNGRIIMFATCSL